MGNGDVFVLNRVETNDCVFLGFCFKYEREVNEKETKVF
jgi:hypothetical protein